ncbi:phosphotransferase [Desmospora profundinema]|uniref:Thiamine kinase-like enzyme n=1 Tax=Desmospora profundinema TaxID=1571184 RepID=A0ABU1IQF6_9BACL|nr:phosphotransferase [Desmospora profundinema]MDR6226374.1 thiamine kinase-like enzyme [Desmospora profundinema]
MNGREWEGERKAGSDEHLLWERLLGERITDIQPFRRNWLVTTSHGCWVAKQSRRPAFLRWWAGVDREMRNRGFKGMPRWLTDGQKWQLSAWIQGRSAQYGDRNDLTGSAGVLGKFHRLGRRLHTPTLSPGRHLIRRVEERFHSFVQLIRTTPPSSQVRQVLQPVEGELLHCGQQVLDALARYPWDYWCGREQRMQSLVHRDLASHNWVWDFTGKGWLIDFDTAGYDLQVGDLWQLLSRAMWEQDWDVSILHRTMAAYERERPLPLVERELLRILLAFPNEIYREALGLSRGDPDYALARTLPYLQSLVAKVSRWRPWTRFRPWLV